MVRRRSTPRKPRSRGSYELARTGLTQDEIARRLGKDQSHVARWLSGSRVPNQANRAELASEFGIEPPAWDEPTATPATPKPPQELEQATVRQRAEELQQLVHELMTQIGGDTKATPLEKAKVYSSTATTLQLLGKLTGDAQEIGETRILRLPAWRRIEERIRVALQPFPKAALAVANALEEIAEA